MQGGNNSRDVSGKSIADPTTLFNGDVARYSIYLCVEFDQPRKQPH